MIEMKDRDLKKINEWIKKYEADVDKNSGSLFLLVCNAYLLGLDGYEEPNKDPVPDEFKKMVNIELEILDKIFPDRDTSLKA